MAVKATERRPSCYLTRHNEGRGRASFHRLHLCRAGRWARTLGSSSEDPLCIPERACHCCGYSPWRWPWPSAGAVHIGRSIFRGRDPGPKSRASVWKRKAEATAGADVQQAWGAHGASGSQRALHREPATSASPPNHPRSSAPSTRCGHYYLNSALPMIFSSLHWWKQNHLCLNYPELFLRNPQKAVNYFALSPS